MTTNRVGPVPKSKEIALYILMGALAVALVFGGLLLPRPHKGVTKSELQKELGSPAAQVAKQAIVQQANSGGVTLTKMTVDKIAKSGTGAIVYLTVRTKEYGVAKIKVTLSKSQYQVADMEQVG